MAKPAVSPGALRAALKVIGGILSAIAVVPAVPLPQWALSIIGILGGGLAGWATTSPLDQATEELPREWQDVLSQPPAAPEIEEAR